MIFPRPKKAPPPLDKATLEYVVHVLQERLDAVVAYGAGGCPTCHEAELRSAVAKVASLRSS